MKTARSLKKIFLIPMLILILGLVLMNCGDGDDGYDDGNNFKLYPTGNIQSSDMAFAQSVALSGNWAVAASSLGMGANVNFFTNDGVTWSSNVTLVGGMGQSIFQFSVDISGDYVVLGVVDGMADFVSLYNLDVSGWKDSGSFVSSNGQFGASVGISGTKVIVGAPGTDTVYFYDVDASPQLVTNTNFSISDVSNEFGYSVDIDGNYAVVGAYGTNNTNGSAYVYEHDGSNWILDQELSNPGPYFNYGISVVICGNNAIVGVNDPNTMAVIWHNDGANWNVVYTVPGSGQINGFVTATISSNYAVAGRVNGTEGYIRVSKYNNGSWNEVGDDMHMGGGFTTNMMGLALDDYCLIVGEPQAGGGWVHFYE